MKVSVLGLGYIGLPTSALIASKGVHVVGVDVNQFIVNTVGKGAIHFVEPDLEGLVFHVVRSGLLQTSDQPQKSDVFLVTVPTPFKENYMPDLTYVTKAIDMIIPHLEEQNLVILESTSPVGTTQKMYQNILKKKPSLKNKFFMAYCPERVLPGKILYELEHNDRVIGGIDPESTEKAQDFYSNFVKGHLHKTDANTAELCKLVENAYRDVNIAFANELSIICDQMNVNVWELIKLANQHPRVNILLPGVGVGGHCIAVDPWFIISHFQDQTKLMKTARQVNTEKTNWVINKIINELNIWQSNNSGREPKILLFGLTYKPDIDDLRESKALSIAKAVTKRFPQTISIEPNLSDKQIENMTDINIVNSKVIEQYFHDADILIFLVKHRAFMKVNQSFFKNKTILDFCGLLS